MALKVLIAAAALLLIGMFSLPYGYYTFLRFVVTLSALYGAWDSFESRKAVSGWTVALVAVAVLFSPLVPVYLTKHTWAVLDAACAAMFLTYVVSNRGRLTL